MIKIYFFLFLLVAIISISIVIYFKLSHKAKGKYTRYVAKCGTVVDKMPYTVKIPEGYELPKFNLNTGRAEYSDGTVAEHLELRKINPSV